MRRILQILLLLLSSLSEEHSQLGCSLQGWTMDSFLQNGDILIGGTFVVHSEFYFQPPTFQELPKPVLCTSFHIRYYRDVLGLIFALNEVNQTPNLLPNVTLGFSLVDTCMSELRAVRGLMSLLSGTANPIPDYDCCLQSVKAGIIGDVYSALSLPIARILGVLHYPQISHGATLSSLSNKINFPSFFRTVTSNAFQNIALSQLVGHFGWTWVGMLVVDNDVGLQGAQVIQASMERIGVCIAFLEKIHLSYSARQISSVVQVIKKSTVNVIVLHCPEVHTKALLGALFAEGVTGKIFITSVSFAITPGLYSKNTWKILNGTIGLIPKTGDMPGFESFLLNLSPSDHPSYPFMKVFWEKAFNCKWTNGDRDLQTSAVLNKNDTAHCTGKEDLGDNMPFLFETNDLSFTYHAYLAVYAYAHALHWLLGCHDGICDEFRNVKPLKVLHHLKKSSFRTRSGEKFTFNADGDLTASYDIINVQVLENTFNFVKVGKVNPESNDGDKITLNISSILWNEKFSHIPSSVCSDQCLPGHRKVPIQGKPVCCYDCIPCSMGEVANNTDASECLKCPVDQWSSEEKDRCIPKVVEFLTYEEPLGIMLVIMVVIFSSFTVCILILFAKHQETPIIKATNRELSYILLVSLILCFLCCLVFIGQPTKVTCLLRQTFFSMVFSISISSVLAKTIMVILAFKATRLNSPLRKWLGPIIPRHVVGLCSGLQIVICSVWLYKSPPFPALNTEIENHKIIFECNEGHKIFFYMTLGFMGFLAMISFFVAFLAKNLPGTYNEAKLITFSMLVFCCVWISFIPAYLSTSGKYTVAVQVFAILASSAGLLSCIFLPKCYILLLRPERNSRELLVSNKKNGMSG
ncbi:extracellular calcium-sensing receptor-like [Ranitomeya variabilis]|uniref:extracellular calcium-sensing receptor-like n=1 Tax=Ranitomeya variabilis TaxID=490064 RepID=UPI0040573C61